MASGKTGKRFTSKCWKLQDKFLIHLNTTKKLFKKALISDVIASLFIYKQKH